MIDIVFVILNFNIYEETLQCIGTIRDKAGTDNYYLLDDGKSRTTFSAQVPF